jgi:hypothetical protein
MKFELPPEKDMRDGPNREDTVHCRYQFAKLPSAHRSAGGAATLYFSIFHPGGRPPRRAHRPDAQARAGQPPTAVLSSARHPRSVELPNI